MSEQLRVGLIGCGRAAERYYLPVLRRQTAKARLVAVADPQPERALLAASFAPECLTFDCAEMLLQKADVDAVIVTSTPETHVPITVKALQAGLPVLVEKPLGISSEQVRGLEEWTPRSRGSVMVGFNQRHWEPVEQLENMLRQRNGEGVLSADLSMCVNAKGWSAIAGMGNPLDDLGPHLLDLVRFLLQREILAIAANQTNDGATELQLQLTGGATAKCRIAYGSVTSEVIDVRLEVERYSIRMGSDRIGPAAGFTRSLLDISDAGRRRMCGRRSSLHYSHERQLLRFLEHVRARDGVTPNVADGLAVVCAIEAAKRSIASRGREVPV